MATGIEDPRQGRGQPSPTASYDELSRRDIAADVYRAFREAGFSDQQSKALTAEINRENSLRPNYLFGEHTDPANRATNVGMLSWQGSRAPQALQFLRDRGVADEAGNITPGYDALRAQAEFIRYEMENNPEYAKTKDIFLSNPEIDPAAAHRVLGDNYIRWRRTDPEYSEPGYGRIYEGYNLLTGQDAEFTPSEGVRPQARPQVLNSVDPAAPQAAPEDQAANKSSLDYLSDALPYLETAQLTGAPQYRFDPPGVRRPQGRSGDDALKRLGIASLLA